MISSVKPLMNTHMSRFGFLFSSAVFRSMEWIIATDCVSVHFFYFRNSMDLLFIHIFIPPKVVNIDILIFDIPNEITIYHISLLKFGYIITRKPSFCLTHNLVGGLEHVLLFHFIYGMSFFPLTSTFFRGVGQPPTSTCYPSYPIIIPLLSILNHIKPY